MAGNGHGEPVGSAGPGHGTHRVRRADATSDVAIACGLPGWYLAERLPDALLEGGATDVERQVEADVRCLNKAHDCGDQCFEGGIAAEQIGVRELILQVLHQGL